MKLIKSGVVPVRKPQEYDGICHNCGCVVRVTSEEFRHDFGGAMPKLTAGEMGRIGLPCPTKGCCAIIRKFDPYITREAKG